MKKAHFFSDQIIFPSFLRLDEKSCDAEQMEQQSLFRPYEHKQFSRGKFQGRIIAFHTCRMQISLALRSTGVYIRGGIPEKSVVISLPLTPHHHFHYQGKILKAGQAVALGQGEEIELQTANPSALLTLVICKDFFDQQCRMATGKSLNDLRGGRRLQIKPGEYEIRSGQLMSFLQTLHSSTRFSQEWEGILIEQKVMKILLAKIQPLGNFERDSGGCTAAGKAEEYILENLKTLPSIAEISRLAGTSERSLHRTFKERFGVTPKSFMQIMRLNGARRDLLFNGSGNSISDIAMEWGFYHLGRFSQQYSHMFGELPRETRRSSLVSK